MSKFWIIMAVVVVGFIATVTLTREEADRPQGEVSNHIIGEGTSGVTLVEYGDFQCPACGQYYPIINTVKDIYGDEISFQFRHFSLFGNFPNSMAAHLAAEAAGNQDRFFDMHDLLYERQESWSPSNNAKQVFEGYAEELDLDMERFRADYASSETRAVINADIAFAREKDVTGTPTFFINDERISNPTGIEEFFEVIDEFIERETGEPSQNSPLNQTGAEDFGGETQLPEDFDLEGVLPTEEETQQ